MIGGAAGLSKMPATPVWGVLADRSGRKPMLVRALAAVGVFTSAVAFARTPLQFAVLRLLKGVFSGVQAAASAVVATETPRARLAWALGIVGAAQAIALAAGPFLGGVLATFLDLRLMFMLSGLTVLVSAAVVAMIVVESGRPAARTDGAASHWRSIFRGALPPLMACQALSVLAYSGGQQLAALRILVIYPKGAALATGVTFGLVGVATAASATTYSRAVGAFGFRSVGAAAGVLISFAIVLLALGSSLGALMPGTALLGLAYGCLGPLLSACTGLVVEDRLRATAFGALGGAMSAGLAIGPALTGGLAAAFGLRGALLSIAALGLVTGGLMWQYVAEPALE